MWGAAMFCVKCGTQLPEDAAFCYKCGTPIQVAASAPPVREVLETLEIEARIQGTGANRLRFIGMAQSPDGEEKIFEAGWIDIGRGTPIDDLTSLPRQMAESELAQINKQLLSDGWLRIGKGHAWYSNRYERPYVPTPVKWAIVANTDGKPLGLRKTTNMRDTIKGHKGIAPGNILKVISTFRDGGGESWLDVRDHGDNAGFVPSRYTKELSSEELSDIVLKALNLPAASESLVTPLAERIALVDSEGLTTCEITSFAGNDDRLYLAVLGFGKGNPTQLLMLPVPRNETFSKSPTTECMVSVLEWHIESDRRWNRLGTGEKWYNKKYELRL